MNIVWSSHSSDIGGAELSLLEGAVALNRAGHRVNVLVPSPGPLIERLDRAGIPVSVTNALSWMHTSRLQRPVYYQVRRLPGHIAAARRTARLLRDLAPDVVVTNTITVPAAAIAARYAGLPHVWYIHEFGWEDHGARFDYSSRVSIRLMRTLSDRVIVNSRAVRDKYQNRFPRGRVSVVPCAVDVNPHAVHTGGGTRVQLVMVGQLAPAKRQEDGVRAVAILRRRGLDVDLTLVGGDKPPYAALLRDLAYDLGIAGSVHMVGSVTNPAPYLCTADMMLMCSRAEALGRVTVEAMKMGCPVVGACSGATTELITDRWSGLLYRPGDARDLADKVQHLCEDRALARSLGDHAREWATREFTRERYVSGLLEAFEGAVVEGVGRNANRR